MYSFTVVAQPVPKLRLAAPAPSAYLPLPCLPASLPSALPDATDFASVAVSGSLYELLMGCCPALDRDSVKKRFLVDVLAKRGHYPSAVERAFRAEFPSVYQIVRAINRDDHAAALNHWR